MPLRFPLFYGEDAGRLFTIYYGVTQACCDRSTHDPHVTHSMRVVGKRNWRGSYCGKTRPRIPAHRFGPSPTTRRTYVWPRPGGSCRCTKVGALLLTPLLVHGQSEPRTTAARSRAKEGSRREAKAQDGQRNAKTKDTKEREGEVDSLGPGRPPQPRQDPCWGNLRDASRASHP